MYNYLVIIAHIRTNTNKNIRHTHTYIYVYYATILRLMYAFSYISTVFDIDVCF